MGLALGVGQQSRGASQLDREVGQFMHGRQTLAYGGRIHAWNGDDANDTRMGVRPNTPDVQIDKLGVTRSLDQFLDFLGNVLVGPIQQNGCRIPHEGPGPTGDHHATDHAHDGIEPNPPEIATCKKGDDRQNGRERVSDDVDVGGTQIVVRAAFGSMMVVTVVVVLAVMVLMPAGQEEGTDDIHAKA